MERLYAIAHLYYPSHPPRKHLSATVILEDEMGRVLIVKPTYRDDWLLPGGVIEANESPREGCMREISEELGLHVSNLSFLCVDYMPPSGRLGESVAFMFHGGRLSQCQRESMVLGAPEIKDVRFVHRDEIHMFLSPRQAKRVCHAIDSRGSDISVYLENGERGE